MLSDVRFQIIIPNAGLFYEAKDDGYIDMNFRA